MNEEVLEDVKKIIIPRYKTLTELNRKQAEVPENCTVIRNPVGTAPIMWFEKNNKIYVAMPGVPFEMKSAMQNEIIPRIKARFKTPSILHKTILTTGVGESFLAQKIEQWENALPANISLAYLPSPGVVKLRLSATGDLRESIENQVNEQVELLKKLIEEHIFGYDEDTLESVIGKLLIKKKQTLATAESCTGGNIAKMITSESGCSAYYLGSVIAYSNKIKEKVLYVNPYDIKTYGAVSQQVVEQMAANVKALYQTDYAIATSGIAGPDGGSPEKPVGTVWIAISTPDKLISEKFGFGDNRERNVTRASITALNMLRKLII